MNMLILGATGRVGSHVVTLALDAGYDVTALVRSPNKLNTEVRNNPNLHVIKGNVLNSQDVELAISDNIDVVFSALATDKNDTLSQATPIIIDAMVKQNKARFISIGTAGILQARSNPEVYRFQSQESRRKSTNAAEDHLAAYHALKSSNLDWTIFCPTYLPDGPLTKQILFEVDMLPENTSRITVTDTAWFTFQHLFNEDFYGYRVGIGEKSM
ncbi:NAD(P)-dependent oxidoreductase [Salipaludibacillus sp. HK11]|uniref:NAD(P)-dependent oxidoreductase n=1 Tax=Salipaludibacillus sp. HK11 TaxID=3394320 RepID=UPI0039FBDBB4